MDTTETVTEDTPKLELKHQFGQTVVGAVAALAAERLARQSYEKVVWAIRARKVR